MKVLVNGDLWTISDSHEETLNDILNDWVSEDLNK